MTNKIRAATRTHRGWAISVLQEVNAIHECEDHGWARDRADPHARDHAVDIARQHPVNPEHLACCNTVFFSRDKQSLTSFGNSPESFKVACCSPEKGRGTILCQWTRADALLYSLMPWNGSSRKIRKRVAVHGLKWAFLFPPPFTISF